MSQRRNWIVSLTDVDDDSYEFGPYTEAAARKAEARVQRWIDRCKTDREGELFVSAYPIHQWGKADEN